MTIEQEREKSRKIAEVFTLLSEENKTRLEDIATGMRIQKEIDDKARMAAAHTTPPQATA